MPITESQLQEQVARYLRMQYPDVLFHSDFGSGVKLTPSQAVRQKRQNGGKRAWPDLFIAKSTIHWEEGEGYERLVGWPGLFIELKREGTRIYKKDGLWASKHIKEQAEILQKLRDNGYCALFATGFDEAKRIIDEYLGGKK